MACSVGLGCGVDSRKMNGCHYSAPERAYNVGISAIELYFPRSFVDLEAYEKYSKVSKGKITIGLGQSEMGFCSDNEDVVSMSRTVLQRLLRNYEIDPMKIGFLAVGTETIIDCSKSVKTELMDLLYPNTDVEGVDLKNACYGGTQALFHAIDYVDSNFDLLGKYAIVVMADIALYNDSAARCTGGAGATAMLISPNAPIVIDRGLRCCHMARTWDFYKPITPISCEYPKVDGKLSVKCYMDSLIGCTKTFVQRRAELSKIDPKPFSQYRAKFFHSPYTALVQKAHGLLTFLMEAAESDLSLRVTEFDLNNISNDDLKKLRSSHGKRFELETGEFLDINRRVGNMYTASLFAQLVVFLAKSPSASLKNRDVTKVEDKLLFFAYGSGSAAALFSATVHYQNESLERMREICRSTVRHLDSRTRYSPQEFEEAVLLREALISTEAPHTIAPPELSHYNVWSDCCYLKEIDKSYRRTYGSRHKQS